MPGVLRPGLLCPKCGRKVTAVFNEWRGSEDVHIREYLHEDDARLGEFGHCTEWMPYDEGLARRDENAAPPGHPLPRDW